MGAFPMTDRQHDIIHHISGAMERYGESAVFDVITRFGGWTEIIASFNIEAGKRLEKIASYHSHDGIKFLKRGESCSLLAKEEIEATEEGRESTGLEMRMDQPAEFGSPLVWRKIGRGQEGQGRQGEKGD